MTAIIVICNMIHYDSVVTIFSGVFLAVYLAGYLADSNVCGGVSCLCRTHPCCRTASTLWHTTLHIHAQVAMEGVAVLSFIVTHAWEDKNYNHIFTYI